MAIDHSTTSPPSLGDSPWGQWYSLISGLREVGIGHHVEGMQGASPAEELSQTTEDI